MLGQMTNSLPGLYVKHECVCLYLYKYIMCACGVPYVYMCVCMCMHARVHVCVHMCINTHMILSPLPLFTPSYALNSNDCIDHVSIFGLNKLGMDNSGHPGGFISG